MSCKKFISLKRAVRVVPVLFCFFGMGMLHAYAEGVVNVPLPVRYPETTWQGKSEAVLRIMHRLDAHVDLVPLKVGEETTYGTLLIKVSRCLKRPETLPADTAVQLHIEDKQETESPVYDGWMFSNDPALGAYAGALYDVQAVSCQGDDVEPMAGPLPQAQTPNVAPGVVTHGDGDAGRSNAGGKKGVNAAPVSLLPPTPTQKIEPPAQRKTP